MRSLEDRTASRSARARNRPVSSGAEASSTVSLSSSARIRSALPTVQPPATRSAEPACRSSGTSARANQATSSSLAARSAPHPRRRRALTSNGMAMTTATPRIASSHNSHGGAPVASPEALEGGGVLAVGSGVVIAEPAGERVGLAVVSVRPARPVRERDCVTDGLSVESAPPFAVRVGWAVSERDSAADGLSVLPESPPPHEAISTAVSDRTAIRKWTGRMAQPSPDSHVNLGPPRTMASVRHRTAVAERQTGDTDYSVVRTAEWRSGPPRDSVEGDSPASA
jgi:hypothetical protein